jgi:hypothetical protein
VRESPAFAQYILSLVIKTVVAVHPALDFSFYKEESTYSSSFFVASFRFKSSYLRAANSLTPSSDLSFSSIFLNDSSKAVLYFFCL